MITENYKAKYEGLLIVAKCLNEMIDASGEREKLTKIAKQKIVENYTEARKFLETAIINEQLHISNQRISRWTQEKKCKSSITQHCYNTCPTQLTYTEQNIIKNSLLNPENQDLPRSYIWAKMKRNDLIISLDTFYRYSNRLFGKPVPPELEKQDTIKIRAKQPFQILHMDSTRVTCKDGHRAYIHFIMDNFSRKILGAVVDESSRSELVALNLKQVIEVNNLYHRRFDLYCDDGPENKGFVNELLKNDKRIEIRKIIASYKDKTNNNMVERWNRNFKYVVMKRFAVKSYKQLVALLPEMTEYANNTNLPVLRTLTPNEVIKGQTYEELNFYQQIEKARQMRIRQNQCADCSKLCFDTSQDQIKTD